MGIKVGMMKSCSKKTLRGTKILKSHGLLLHHQATYNLTSMKESSITGDSYWERGNKSLERDQERTRANYYRLVHPLLCTVINNIQRAHNIKANKN